MLQKNEIISKLKELKPVYEQDGLILVGLFGSYAKDTQNNFSDIDIAYKLNYDKFSKKYKDGFSKILKIDHIKEELQHLFKTKVDLVPDNNKALFKEIVYV